MKYQHQSIEEILRSASPAQRVMWQQVLLIAGEYAAIKQHFVFGNTPAELLTYSANNLFIALRLRISGAVGASPTLPLAILYNENNAGMLTMTNSSVAWNTTAANMQYTPNDVEINDVYFSRVALTAYNNIDFVGYKISF